jgi:hypothetical protein
VAGKHRFGGIGKYLTGHLPGGRASHAIGNQAVMARFTDIKYILIVGADISHVRSSVVIDCRQFL